MAGEADSKNAYKYLLPMATEYPAVNGNNVTIIPLKSSVEEIVQCGK
jgi:hypothetical protein